MDSIISGHDKIMLIEMLSKIANVDAHILHTFYIHCVCRIYSFFVAKNSKNMTVNI